MSAVPQYGIFAAGQSHQVALEFLLSQNVEDDAVRAALSNLALDGCVLALEPVLHRRLSGQSVEGLVPFEAIEGSDGKVAPATQGDVLVWLQASERDTLFDAARAAAGALAPVATLALECTGFRYHDSRDLTGFIDGTANPTGALARQTALDTDGGAHVLTQKWVHDLPAFEALPISAQEEVIGRTKADSVELTGDAMPADSHVSRTDVAVDGEPQRIYRRSFPYGSLSEHGLFVLAFASDATRFRLMLARMFGVAGDGVRDRLTDFSKPVSGAYWYAPGANALAKML
ncbi:MAG: Dyp-type peroxidase [Alphaproteobacteria bacterium]|jgi:putative iron-dependent peroxidase|nr:Dyp-type peroxidase [Alphaproteobacteria bacterium]